MILNADILEMEYAVRGPIPQRAAVLRGEGRAIIPCNLGNPQAFGQRPLTHARQVLSLLENPSGIARERRLAELEDCAGAVPGDILDRCESLLAELETGMGAYTDSSGHGLLGTKSNASPLTQEQTHEGSFRYPPRGTFVRCLVRSSMPGVHSAWNTRGV